MLSCANDKKSAFVVKALEYEPVWMTAQKRKEKRKESRRLAIYLQSKESLKFLNEFSGIERHCCNVLRELNFIFQ